MRTEERIKQFARQSLGCECPDEVFDNIEVRPGDAEALLPHARSITIGGRLLIHIYGTSDPALVEAHLPEIIAAGADERDRRGLNRFRAVIASDDIEAVDSAARRVFGQLRGLDDNIHLHVVRREDVADF